MEDTNGNVKSGKIYSIDQILGQTNIHQNFNNSQVKGNILVLIKLKS